MHRNNTISRDILKVLTVGTSVSDYPIKKKLKNQIKAKFFYCKSPESRLGVTTQP